MGRRQTRTPGLCGEGDGVVGRTCSADIPPQGWVPLLGLQPGVWHSPRAAGGCRLLEDIDLVPLDTVQVIVQRQQHLWREGSEGSRALGSCGTGELGTVAAVPVEPAPTRKEPNMAMEERKCQMSWSSKKSSRMQSRLCSRDSAGVFCRAQGQCHCACPWPPCPPCCLCHPPTHLPGAETLEEEEEGEAPDHGGADDAEQRDELDALATAELWGRLGSPCGQELAAVPIPALPSLLGTRGPRLNSHLHDNVEGEVEEEVADTDGQQVRSKIIWADNEAVGSTGEAGTGSGVSLGVPLPCPLSPKHVCSPQEIRQHVGTLACHSCRGTCHAGLTTATSCPSSAQPHGGMAGLQEPCGGGSRDEEKQGGIWHMPSSALTVTS